MEGEENAQLSMSVQETNKLRASLGLKPLREESNDEVQDAAQRKVCSSCGANTCEFLPNGAYIHSHIHTHTPICTHKHTHTHTHAQTNANTHTHTHIHTCTHARTHAHTHAHTHTHTYTHARAR
jgi:hypothetical protein